MAKSPTSVTENQTGLKPAVSVLPDFMWSFMELSKETQRKVAEFFEKFSKNPTSPGINYETLIGVTDDKVRSVRIDGVYRAIVVTPEKGNVYLLVRVDREDDLYRWVKDLKFSRTENSAEVMVTRLVQQEESMSVVSGVRTEGLLAHCSDDALQSIGVPPLLLPSVRAIGHQDGYGYLWAYLSQSTIMALRFLANELPIDEVTELYSEYGEAKRTSGMSPVQLTATLKLLDKIDKDRKDGRTKTDIRNRMIEALYKARDDHSESDLVEKVARHYPE